MLRKIVLFLLIFLIPIDWFAPTGNLLAEAGSKPSNVFFILAFLFTLIFHRNFLKKINASIINSALIILTLSIFGMLINISNGWSDFNYYKNPLVQFFNQSLMLIVFFLSIATVSYILEQSKNYNILNFVTIAAFLHLAIFMAEFSNLISDKNSWLTYFRVDEGAIERATGLMSEPSYFGTAAALLGFPLIFINDSFRYKYIRILIGLTLIIFSFIVNAKTILLVLLFQTLIFLLYRKISIKIYAFLLIGTFFAYNLIASTQVLNTEENISSAIRLGSSHLALNVILNGYGITGIGIGQFHYFYLPEYAPSYLTSFSGAYEYFGSDIQSRASTYNIFLRFFIETGFLGLFIFINFIKNQINFAMKNKTINSEIGLYLIAGSIGFLMTQDTYSYPPLILGLALVLSERSRLYRIIKLAREKT